MRKFCLFLTLIIFCLSASTLFACDKGGSSLDCYYFKTGIHIETHDKPLTDKTVAELKNLFSSLENEFDNKKEDSLVYSFNNLGVGEKISLSKHGANVLSLSKRCFSFTDGLFDPSVYPLVKLWQFSPNYPVNDFTPPTEEQILETLNTVGFDGATFNFDDDTLTKNKEGVMLDFGGIVKGYAADRGAEILKNAGHNSGYISIGGSSLRILSVESLGVIHPKKANLGQSILSVNLKGKKDLSVSTSGDYEKSYVFGNKSYSHLINPKTGYPADTGVHSVTVIGADGGFSDAVTTAACLKEHHPNSALTSPLTTFLSKILNEYPTAQVYAIYDDGINKQILTNQNQGESFTLLDSEYTIINFN